jgi:imidazolonepropionase
MIRGLDMKALACVQNAYLLIENDRIHSFGTQTDTLPSADTYIDAEGGMVFPSWCDSHTHLVFAASRESEFVDRINGLSYQEIAEKGGGILNSAKRLQAMSEDDLFQKAFARLQEVIRMGTGLIEIKSGYGLTVEAEIKMLRVIKRLKAVSPIPIKASFLGAHAFPMEYKTDRRQAYIDLITNEMLPKIAAEQLADYIDVFCEKNFFQVHEMEQILVAGAQYGLAPKVHVNQFYCMGGIAAAIRHNAISVDHLEVLNDEDILALQQNNCIATLLPSAPFFLNDHYPPARKLLDANVPVALASDYNPGTTPSGKMAFVVALACINMKMTPEEAINAATINGAAALQISDDYGSIAIGKVANVFITKPMPSIAYLPYAFGSELIHKVILSGKEFF